MTTRLERMRTLLATQRLDCVLTASPPDIQYFTGIQDPVGFLLIGQDVARPTLFVPQAKFAGAREAEEHAIVVPIPMTERPLQIVGRYIAHQAVTSLGIESCTPSFVDGLTSYLGGVPVRPIDGLCARCRRKKSQEELDLLRKAARVADAMMAGVRTVIAPGVTELDLAAEADYRAKRLGSEVTAFPTQVRAGRNAWKPSYYSTPNLLAPGDMVTVDVGPRCAGYGADLTRTFVVREPGAEQLKVMSTVLQAEQTAISLVRPGRSAREVDGSVRDYFASEGLDAFFPHHTGHGLGLGGDVPRAQPLSDDVIEVGDCMALEPGLYVSGTGGARFEDDVAVCADDNEVITTYSKRLEDLIVG